MFMLLDWVDYLCMCYVCVWDASRPMSGFVQTIHLRDRSRMSTACTFDHFAPFFLPHLKSTQETRLVQQCVRDHLADSLPLRPQHHRPSARPTVVCNSTSLWTSYGRPAGSKYWSVFLGSSVTERNMFCMILCFYHTSQCRQNAVPENLPNQLPRLQGCCVRQ